MKPVDILLLILAGALGGAVIMMVTQPARLRHPIAITAREESEKLPAPQLADSTPEAPAALGAAPPAPTAEAPAPAPVETVPATRPSPFPVAQQAKTPETAAERNEMKPRHPVVQRVAPPPVAARMTQTNTMRREPVMVAQTQQSAPLSPPPTAAPQQSQPPAQQPPPEPAPVTSAPPARIAPENQTPAPAPPAPTPHTVTLNAGLLLPVRLVDSLSSDRNQIGDRFSASLDRELVVEGFVIAERGARVEGQLVAVDRGTKTKGNALLSLEVTAILTSDNQYVRVQTDAFNKLSEPNHTTDAEKIGGGAVVGAIIGAVAGGGKGAAIGAGVGGGAGAGDVLLTRKPATLASETRISFRMRAPVTITEKLQ